MSGGCQLPMEVGEALLDLGKELKEAQEEIKRSHRYIESLVDCLVVYVQNTGKTGTMEREFCKVLGELRSLIAESKQGRS